MHVLLPQVGGPPARVTINLSILTMGPIDEDTQSFSLDCYFRQSWRDDRLGYDAAGVSALALNWQFLEKIWCVVRVLPQLGVQSFDREGCHVMP